jgi:hypothetical protein
MAAEDWVSIGGNFYIRHTFQREGPGLIVEKGLTGEMAWIKEAVQTEEAV